jgi:hypothetical protein
VTGPCQQMFNGVDKGFALKSGTLQRLQMRSSSETAAAASNQTSSQADNHIVEDKSAEVPITSTINGALRLESLAMDLQQRLMD